MLSTETINRQLPLGLHLRDDATFENYYPGPNARIVTHLQHIIHHKSDSFIYLWGKEGTGRTHLLQACCHAAMAQGFSAVYFTFRELEKLSPEIFENLESIDFICLDDVGKIENLPQWQEALFHLYNRIRQNGHSYLLVTGDISPVNLPLMPDLTSRLSWGVSYQTQELSDTEKVIILQMRAKIRGLYLSAELGKFLLTRCSREMKDLFQILETLDHASLSAQRRLTIPFVKLVLKL